MPSGVSVADSRGKEIDEAAAGAFGLGAKSLVGFSRFPLRCRHIKHIICSTSCGNSVELRREGPACNSTRKRDAAARALQLHGIAKVSLKNSRTVLQQQPVQGRLYDRVGSGESRA